MTTTKARGIFNDDRTDVPDLGADIGTVLPPAHYAPPAAGAEYPDAASTGSDSVTDTVKRPARGRGGRTPGEQEQALPVGITLVGARVPRPLYEEVVKQLSQGVERPSYAQLISWACEDHPADVLAELQRIVDSYTIARGRAPRGRRLAGDTTQLTLRFHPDELNTLDQVRASANDPQAKATRTAAAIAAFRVAIASEQRATASGE